MNMALIYPSLAKKAQKIRFYRSNKYQIILLLLFFATILSALLIIFDLNSLMVLDNLILALIYWIFSGSFIILILTLNGCHQFFNQKNKLSQQAIDDEKADLIDYLSVEAILVFNDCWETARNHKIKTILPNQLLMALANSDQCQWVLARMGFFISQDQAEELLTKLSQEQAGFNASLNYSQEFLDLIKNALKIALAAKKENVDALDLLKSFWQYDKTGSGLLFTLGLQEEDAEDIISWYKDISRRFDNRSKSKKNYYRESIGQNWIVGYTPGLDSWAINISSYLTDLNGYYSPGQRENIAQAESILAQERSNNVIIIGRAGSGKKTIINGIGEILIAGKTSQSLRFKHIFKLDSARILSGAKEEINYRLIRIFDEAASVGNVIIYLENLADYLTHGDEEIGKFDASEIILSYISSGRIQIMATSNQEDFHLKIENNGNLMSYFGTITIIEPTSQEMMEILKNAVLAIEHNHQTFFSYLNLKKAIELADQYILDIPFPKKVLGILEEVAVISQKDTKPVSVEMIEEIVSRRAKVPVSLAKAEEKEYLLNLENQLHKRIIGQDEAIKTISATMRRARSGLADKNKPMGSFLFLGPTGVGKTETAKSLAEACFQSEKNIIRFDMSEFQEIQSLELLIGSTLQKGALSQGRLTQAVHNNPYSLILFDEIEKAHPKILDLFLQLLDEGAVSDSSGQKVTFSNTVVIATSNAGAEKIRENIQKGITKANDLKKDVLEYLQKERIFRPEFLNRFDAIICFEPLDLNLVEKIAKLMIDKLILKLKDKEINLQIGDEVIKKIAQLGYDPVYGARPLKRIIQQKIEDLIANKILSDQVSRGQTLEILAEDI